jgi:hypothetical protein
VGVAVEGLSLRWKIKEDAESGNNCMETSIKVVLWS